MEADVFNDTGIHLKIPNNWGLVKLESINVIQQDGYNINDTKIILTDGKSTIRIDKVRMPQMRWMLNWSEGDYGLSSLINSFYIKEVLKTDYSSRRLEGSSNRSVTPDGNDGTVIFWVDKGAEWIVAWANPDYLDYFIGVHAIFNGEYEMANLTSGETFHFYMQKDLFDLLNSFDVSDQSTRFASTRPLGVNTEINHESISGDETAKQLPNTVSSFESESKKIIKMSELPSKNDPTAPGDPSHLEEIYLDHNLCFAVPEGWNVIKDYQEGNDTQIVLSDGSNALRIDLLEDQEIGRIVGDYLDYHVSKSELLSLEADISNLSGEDWHRVYQHFPWYSNDAVCEYYQEKIIKPVTQISSTGSGISVLPDGVEYAGVATNNGHDGHSEIDEWFIAWTKPEYNNKIIGVHSLFKGDFPEVEVDWHGSSIRYAMPEPLWILLTTINRGNKPLPRESASLSLVEMV